MNIPRLATLAIMIAGAVLAQKTAPMVVDANWLSSHLNDRDLVLIHVGPKAGYESGHIPGARLVSLFDIAKPMEHKDPMEIMLELPAVDVLRSKLEALGISDDSRIVVYFGVKSEFQSATRVVYTLDYIGLGGRTSLLDGGLPAWAAAGKQTTTTAPTVATGKLIAQPTKNVVADAEIVKAVSQHANQKLVDGRAPVYYNGTEATYEKKGHIPGAINIPFSDILDSKLMIDRDRIEKLFTAAGVKPGDSIVAYCHIGQQATAVVFASRLLGHQVMLYDGSFEDWAKNSRGPVEK